jgi:hypothetical protein
MKSTDITPCSQLKVNRRYRGTYSLHLQARGISRARKQVASFHVGFLLDLFFDPEDGGDVPPKRRLAFSGLHVIISQKLVLIIINVFQTECHSITNQSREIRFFLKLVT